MKKFSLFQKQNERCLSYPVRDYPQIYNVEGNLLKMFYLKDQILAPYCESRYFMWDRCNYGLDTHFYTHNNMLFTQGSPTEKYGMLIESKQIVPDNYRIFDKYRGLEKEFNAVFTYDSELLNKLPNAKFFPGCAYVWYGRTKNGFEWDPECYEKKCREISIVSSDKRMCHLHKARIELSKYCKKNHLADTFGTFDGGELCCIDDSLKDYRFSIIVENDISDYFFTEKLTNCFASQTIPIYLGAKKIDEFFNKDGIIVIEEKQLENIESVLKQCTASHYEEHIEAIKDNYRRAYAYQNIFDWLYEHYFMNKS